MSSLKHRLEDSVRQESRVVKGLRTELAQKEKDLATALDQLEKARSAHIDPIKPTKPRPKLKGDIVRVAAGDVHGCKQNRAAVAAFIGDLKALQPDEIIWGGDILDCGGFLAQHHTIGYVAETSYTYEQDVAAGNVFLDAVRAVAPNAFQEYLEGNHEQRVERWCVTEALANAGDSEMLRRMFSPQTLLKLQERGIPYYRMSEYYDGVNVPGFIKRGKMYYTHGSFVTAKHATARIQSRVSGNVTFFNTHRAQAEVVRKVGVGAIGAFNPGCLCELQQLWHNTDPSEWTNGYALQFISRTGTFLNVNIPIVDGESLLVPLMSSNELPT